MSEPRRVYHAMYGSRGNRHDQDDLESDPFAHSYSPTPTSSSFQHDHHQSHEMRPTSGGTQRVDILTENFKEHFKYKIAASANSGSSLLSWMSNKESEFTLNLAPAQSFVLFSLQTKIARGIDSLRKNTSEDETQKFTDQLTRTMHEYCDAVRDIEYIKQWTDQKRTGRDSPFQLRPSRYLERVVLSQSNFISDKEPLTTRGNAPRLPGDELTRKLDLDSLNAWQRLMVAFVTGALIVVPVFAITYVNVRLYNLLIACGFMALVALVTLLPPIFRTRDALAITAAYISVLVIFVGAKIKI